MKTTDQTSIALVVTTIQAPTPAMRALMAGCITNGRRLIVVGDKSTPADFDLDGCDFLALDRQRDEGGAFADLLPVGHYARKNLGYLRAMKRGAEVIIETDDDNFPYDSFWTAPEREVVSSVSEGHGWVNAYRFFVEDQIDIWPRGLPWSEIGRPLPGLDDLHRRAVFCPIQQGLANDDPDVDAIWRLTKARPVTFMNDPRIALGSGSWCPFNSQNTRWFRPAFPLLYLPASCHMRLTDIWRSFVAQRVMWANGWHLLMHGPTMYQQRNQHDLRADIIAEFPGYAHNAEIARRLSDLEIPAGDLGKAMLDCYELLISMGLLLAWERECLKAWLAECPS